MAGGGWQAAGGRWQVAGGRWQVALAGGRQHMIPEIGTFVDIVASIVSFIWQP